CSVRFTVVYLLASHVRRAGRSGARYWLLVAALREVDVLVRERLLVELGCVAVALVLPRCHVGVVLVVAECLALRRLALLAEVGAARLAAVERVEADELRELEEVGDAPRLLERLIELRVAPGN